MRGRIKTELPSPSHHPRILSIRPRSARRHPAFLVRRIDLANNFAITPLQSHPSEIRRSVLAVLPSPRESQVHGPRNYAQSKIRKEGRSSLHAFPPHRPLIRLAFCRQNSKITGPVGKVRLIGALCL